MSQNFFFRQQKILLTTILNCQAVSRTLCNKTTEAWDNYKIKTSSKFGETNSDFVKPSDEQTIYFAQEKFAFR